MNRNTARSLAAAALLAPMALVLLATGCELDVNPNRDTIAEESAIHGTVVVDGAVTSDVILLLYQCIDPPPPEGTGRPMDFIVVNRSEFRNNEAEYIFPSVAPGAAGTGNDDAMSECYLLVSIMDTDHDWNPFYGVTGQLSGGDFTNSVIPEVEVFGAEDEGGVVPIAEGVQIIVDHEVPHDRPTFGKMKPTHKSNDLSPYGQELGNNAKLQLKVESQTGYCSGTGEEQVCYDILYTSVDINPITTSVVDMSNNPKFELVFEPDEDGNGVPEDYNGDGLPDIAWPRVLFLKLDYSEETGDPDGLVTVSPPIVIPGVIAPFDLPDAFNFDHDVNHLTRARDEGIPFDGETIMPTEHLNVIIPEVVVTDLETKTLDLLENVAQTTDVLGDYQILIMNASGQVWNKPNELVEFGIPLQNQKLKVVD